MSKTYRPYDPDQQLLLPAALQEWLPDDHLAYFISDVVNQLDLSEITAHDESRLRPQGPPADAVPPLSLPVASATLRYLPGRPGRSPRVRRRGRERRLGHRLSRYLVALAISAGPLLRLSVRSRRQCRWTSWLGSQPVISQRSSDDCRAQIASSPPRVSYA